ncbi:hypothetical protein [Roseateles sp. P5_E11]
MHNDLSPARRFMAVACLATACSSATWALPLAPGVTREINFVSDHSTCTGLLPLGGDSVSCTLTNGADLTASFADYYGSPSSGSAHVFVNGMDMHLSVKSTPSTVPTSVIDAVQFDQFMITGPTPTVQVGVTVTLDGTTARSASGFVLTSYTFISGKRSLTPSASANAVADRIANDPSRDVLAFGRTATFSGGVTQPTLHRVDSASFTAVVGTPFERGFEFAMSSLNTSLSFSARVEYSLPVGYTLTSARGLAVNAVPENGSWALMLAGLVGLGGLRLAKSRNVR